MVTGFKVAAVIVLACGIIRSMWLLLRDASKVVCEDPLDWY